MLYSVICQEDLTVSYEIAASSEEEAEQLVRQGEGNPQILDAKFVSILEIRKDE